MTATLAILGGSGLYEMPELQDAERVDVETPYGPPSDSLLRARLGDVTLLFLPRHGRGHRIAPSAINYRANVCALKLLGATHVVSVSAVGSMREEIAPGDLLVVDQFIDWTRRRVSTYFDEGVAAHVAFADPVCPILAAALLRAARTTSARVHERGTYLCIEGPQFSTRAESMLYRAFGVSVIGMTNMPEAKLAREAELPYATLALSTDYDCWREGTEAVTAEAVVETLRRNVENARATLRALAAALPDVSGSPARVALDTAIMTPLPLLPPATRARLAWLLDARRA